MFTVKIDGMMCDGCQKRVEGALHSLGVVGKVSLKDGKATIQNTGNKDISEIVEAIEDLGFDAELI